MAATLGVLKLLDVLRRRINPLQGMPKIIFLPVHDIPAMFCMPLGFSEGFWSAQGAYYDEGGGEIDTATLETTEQEIARKHVRSDDVVLELGGRYGTVSCIINDALADRRNHVVVEPDANVLPALFRNRELHGAGFTVFEGTVSRGAKVLVPNGYSTMALSPGSTDLPAALLPTKTLEQLEAEHGSRFTVLVADCEGCMREFVDENPGLFERLRMVTYEQDMEDRCDYGVVRDAMVRAGLTCVLEGFHMVWVRQV